MKKYIYTASTFLLLTSCTPTNTVQTPITPVTQIPEAAQVETVEVATQEQMAAKKEETSQSPEESTKMMKETMQDTDTMKKDDMMKKDEMMWTYTEYSQNHIGMHEKTVLFFHAPWCPSCKAADIGIKKWDIPKNLAILKVDYDSSDELKQKYGVTYQHTFVQVDAEGNMIKKWAGGNTLQDILDEVK